MNNYSIKLLIFGGRTFTDYNKAREVISFYLQNHHKSDVLIIQGDAKGADSLGLRYAKDNGIDHHDYPADWGNLNVEPCVVKKNRSGGLYNAVAGHTRNKLMGDACTHAIGFWDGKSTGTRNMRDYLSKKGKKCKIFRYDLGK